MFLRLHLLDDSIHLRVDLLNGYTLNRPVGAPDCDEGVADGFPFSRVGRTEDCNKRDTDCCTHVHHSGVVTYQQVALSKDGSQFTQPTWNNLDWYKAGTAAKLRGKVALGRAPAEDDLRVVFVM